MAAQPDRTFTGSGLTVNGPFSLDAGLSVTEWSYSGTGNFVVWLKDGYGQNVALIANIIGSGSGSTVAKIPTTGQYYLAVEYGTGTWSLTARQPVATSAAPGTTFSGTGDRATALFYLAPGAHIFTWSYIGPSNFIVWLYDSSGTRVDLVANQIGSSSGTTLVSVPGGIYILGVESQGAWQIDTPYVAPPAPAPVYRFYNFTNNTHFLTPSPQERDAVMAKWSNVFRFEGVAYYTNPANNTQPLYRFYNRNSKSHFYTASATERDMVLTRWSNVFTYDGETYSVNTGPVPGSLPVYRFFNMRNGSHFYTASDTERDTVLANWPTVYRLEGPAFWIGQ